MSYVFVFPLDLVKTFHYCKQSRKLFRSRLQNPLAHQLRYASVDAGRGEVLSSGF
jgi:hypothetical protein